MAPIDYAKWNNALAASDDDDDDDERPPGRPRVTRLEGPSQITLGHKDPVAAGPQPNVPPGPMTTKPAGGGGGGGSGGSKSAAVPRPVRAGLDYSRWDHIDVSDDDDEDGGGSGDDGMEVDGDFGGDREDDDRDLLDAEELARARAVLNEQQQHKSQPPLPQQHQGEPSALAKATTAFDALRAKLTRNGAEREAYLWRQTETEVELSILLPPGTRARDLRPELMRAADDVASTDGTAAAAPEQVLVVHKKQHATDGAGNSSYFFRGALAFPVTQPETADDLPWEVSDYEPQNGRRVLRVTLRKEVVHNVVHWWERVLQGEDSVDTTAFPDRKRRAGDAEKHQSVWREAERMFREKVAQRGPPQQIEV